MGSYSKLNVWLERPSLTSRVISFPLRKAFPLSKSELSRTEYDVAVCLTSIFPSITCSKLMFIYFNRYKLSTLISSFYILIELVTTEIPILCQPLIFHSPTPSKLINRLGLEKRLWYVLQYYFNLTASVFW